LKRDLALRVVFYYGDRIETRGVESERKSADATEELEAAITLAWLGSGCSGYRRHREQ
jgi:hypothetical protein